MISDDIPYSEYGSGSKLLFAFHGYGMDGDQFRVLQNTLNRDYRIIAFHMPYHRYGPPSHKGWLQCVKNVIHKRCMERKTSTFSLAGYSIGARVALSLVNEFHPMLKELFLFAPYGLEDHWGLKFVTRGIGSAFFKAIVKTDFPVSIMKLATFLGVIDLHHFEIIRRELLTDEKRISLYRSLKMAGEISLYPDRIIKQLNDSETSIVIAYGDKDVLFPYKNRNRQLLAAFNNPVIIRVDEGHWLVTDLLDKVLASKTQPV